jgi:hypothetical protein
MTEGTPAGIPRLLRLAMLSAGLGSLVALGLFIHAGPYALVAFMMVAQPLLGLGIVLFVVQVLRDLRKEGLLKS